MPPYKTRIHDALVNMDQIDDSFRSTFLGLNWLQAVLKEGGVNRKQRK